MSADKEVMAFFPNTLSKQECDLWLEKIAGQRQRNGYSFLACTLKSSGEFVGVVRLNIPDYVLPCGSCTEVGWRLARQHWKKGYASEAARACLDYGFKQLKLNEILAFAVKDNLNSIKVMERIGMVDTQANFLHPKVAQPHLKEHVLYKATADAS
jgi:ribosomal-protein-alanine N-acetyltransferase